MTLHALNDRPHQPLRQRHQGAVLGQHAAAEVAGVPPVNCLDAIEHRCGYAPPQSRNARERPLSAGL